MTSDPSFTGASPQYRPATTLRRSLGLPLLTLYGLGTTIGAGIYVLIGRVAARAGLYAPVSFLLAALMVLLTALTFAELSSRYPKSAGEAVYVKEAFGAQTLAMLVGLLVVFNGIVSSAALANGFVGYFQTFVAIPEWAIILGVVALIVLLSCWGIGESVTAAAVVTIIEIGGLMLIVWAGGDGLVKLADSPSLVVPPFSTGAWAGILGGSFLAFYAFIGFEDMVNVAEEVKNVRRTLPIAIVLTLAITTLIYVLVALVAVTAVPLDELSASAAPLALIFESRTGMSGSVISLIGILAVLNGALIQIIMASRVLYGMSRQGWLPGALGNLNARTQTPVIATFVVGAVVTILALGFAIDILAQSTSLIMLTIAVLVNGSLWRIKLSRPVPPDAVGVPIWVPVLGLVISIVFAGLVLADLVGTRLPG